MTLDLLENGEVAKISNFNVTEQLLERFFSLGLSRAKMVKKVYSTLGDSTILIECDRMCLMLRSDEAKSIEVEKFNEKDY
ncbi:FeoA family protein [Campylobacter sp. P0085]|uniref:FeoA family protein n=1 Tax=Campylobacter sp. P0085 TaxID=1895597 RepID=UPI000A34FB9D|nr:FeoA family protein [Campylobacter sp. P0085]